MTTPLVLASSSKFRKSLLEKLGLPFQCISPNVDELSFANETSEKLAERLSVEKARAVANQLTQGLVIGSDQVADLNGAHLGKPLTNENAIKQLTASSGLTVKFYTGLCVIDAETGKYETAMDLTEVTFRELRQEQIEYYVKTEQPLHCAGSFKSEGLGISLFKSLKTSDPNALVGLPLMKLVEILERFGVDVLADTQ